MSSFELTNNILIFIDVFFFSLQSRMRFDSVIFLIRNPFHALVSEFNRRISGNRIIRLNNSHTQDHDQIYFLGSKNWKKFIRNSILKWKLLFNWTVDIPEGHDILVVRYEDLKANVTKEVKRMMNFLHYKPRGKNVHLLCI